MKLWLDDLRTPPENWSWVKAAGKAIEQLGEGNVTEISLDHDLGDPEEENGTGYQVACWLEEQAAIGNWSLVPAVIRVHSANPVGVMNMEAAIAAIERMRRERAEHARARTSMCAYQVRYVGDVSKLAGWVERHDGIIYHPDGQDAPEAVVVLPSSVSLADMRQTDTSMEDFAVASISALGLP